MADTTPILGIHHPTGATKAAQLGDELTAMANDMEAALLAASFPPVTPAPIMVAASAAARDAYWRVPATESERLTLQRRGAITIRTDTGAMERYHATYDAATNPAGAMTPGWYGVVSGNLRGASGANLPAAETTVTFPETNLSGGITLQSGGLRVPLTGRYLITARAQVTLSGTAPWRNWSVRRLADNVVLGSTAGTLQPDQLSNVVAALSFETPLTAGDVVALTTSGSGTAASTVTHARVGFSATLIR
jgi:hypothetical protein